MTPIHLRMTNQSIDGVRFGYPADGNYPTDTTLCLVTPVITGVKCRVTYKVSPQYRLAAAQRGEAVPETKTIDLPVPVPFADRCSLNAEGDTLTLNLTYPVYPVTLVKKHFGSETFTFWEKQQAHFTSKTSIVTVDEIAAVFADLTDEQKLHNEQEAARMEAAKAAKLERDKQAAAQQKERITKENQEREAKAAALKTYAAGCSDQVRLAAKLEVPGWGQLVYDTFNNDLSKKLNLTLDTEEEFDEPEEDAIAPLEALQALAHVRKHHDQNATLVVTFGGVWGVKTAVTYPDGSNDTVYFRV